MIGKGDRTWQEATFYPYISMLNSLFPVKGAGDTICRFLRFPGFFLLLCSSYFISGFGAGNLNIHNNVHRALCCLFRPDTDGTRVSKCGQLSQQTRRLDPMLFQCWSSAVGGWPILKQHWVKCSRLLGSTQVSVYTHPSATIIFSPADQGTFSKTAGQSQAYYNT